MDAALNGPSGQMALGPAVLTIGRAPANGLVVNDVKASSRHAEISPAGSGYSITDVGSTNGTFVNEQRLDRNAPRMLTSGDRVRIGDTVFTYEGPGAFQQDATVYAGEGSGPGYQPTVAVPPPYTNYNQGYAPPQQGAWGAGNQQFTPQPQQAYPPPSGAYPSYVPPVPPVQAGYGASGYAGTAAPPETRRSNRNLLLGLGVGGIALIVLLIVLFAVVLPSTPSKTLDAFCNGLKSRDYQTAYNQLSVRQQGLGSESTFANDFSSITNCSHGSPAESGNTASTTLTLVGTISGQPGSSATGTVTLIKENGNWKIDNVTNLTPSGQ